MPRDGATVGAGTVRVGGHAWAQHTGIEKVEYRLDGDAWREAELGRVPGNDTWVQWAGTVDVRAGAATRWRCGPPTGPATRRPRRAPTWCPNGATGWHSVQFSAG